MSRYGSGLVADRSAKNMRISQRAFVSALAICLGLLLFGCSAPNDDLSEPNQSSEQANIPRSVIISLGTAVEAEVSFLIEDDSGEMSETVIVDPGKLSGHVPVPESVAADATMTAIFKGSSGSEEYEVVGEPEKTNAFSEVTSELPFLFEVRKVVAEVGAAAGDPKGSITWQMSSEKGYSYDLTVELFPAVSEGMIGEHVIGKTCEFDSKTDIAIPGKMRVTATTKSFATPVSAGVRFWRKSTQPYAGQGEDPTQRQIRLDFERFFSDGPKCDGWLNTENYPNNSMGVSWEKPFEAGNTGASDFVIIVKNYFTPNTPDGDGALLDWITMSAGRAGSSNEQTGVFTAEGETDMWGASARGLNLNGLVVEPSSK